MQPEGAVRAGSGTDGSSADAAAARKRKLDSAESAAMSPDQDALKKRRPNADNPPSTATLPASKSATANKSKDEGKPKPKKTARTAAEQAAPPEPAPEPPKLRTIEQIQADTRDVTCLNHAFYVDQAIMTEEERLVVIRFGSHDDPDCQRQDEVLQKLVPEVRQWVVFYKCDNRPRSARRSLDAVPWGVPDFNQMYELYDKCTIMFFYRNKHMMCDFGTGNNNKINWVLDNKREMEMILTVIWQGARKGRGLVNCPKDYSTRHAY